MSDKADALRFALGITMPVSFEWQSGEGRDYQRGFAAGVNAQFQDTSGKLQRALNAARSEADDEAAAS